MTPAPDKRAEADLLACPVCGTAPEEAAESVGGAAHRVYCPSPGCWADGPLSPTRKAAVAAWNTRSTPPAAPVAQQSEGGDDLPRDEQGRTAYDIIRDSNHAAAMLRAGIKDRSREPLLGPPADMTVSRVLLAERPELSPTDADALAVKINDALATQPALPEAAGAGELREHFQAMQRMATAYLLPEDYRDRDGRVTLQGDENNTDLWKAAQAGQRAIAFAGDMIYMLDGPEERSALAAPPVQPAAPDDALQVAREALTDAEGDRDFLLEAVGQIQEAVRNGDNPTALIDVALRMGKIAEVRARNETRALAKLEDR